MIDSELARARQVLGRRPRDPAAWEDLLRLARSVGDETSALEEVLRAVAPHRGSLDVEQAIGPLLKRCRWIGGPQPRPASLGLIEAIALAPDGSQVAVWSDRQLRVFRGPWFGAVTGYGLPPGLHGEEPWRPTWMKFDPLGERLGALFERGGPKPEGDRSPGSRRLAIHQFRADSGSGSSLDSSSDSDWETSPLPDEFPRVLACDPVRGWVVGSVDSELWVWRRDKSSRRFSAGGPLHTAALSPQDDVVALTFFLPQASQRWHTPVAVQLLDLITLEAGPPVPVDDTRFPRISFSADASRIAVGSTHDDVGGTSLTMSCRAGLELSPFPAAAVTPRTEALWPGPGADEVSSGGMAAAAWSGREVRAPRPVMGATTFAGVGEQLALARADEFVVMDRERGRLLGTLHATNGPVVAAAFSADGRELRALCDQHILRTYAWPSGTAKRTQALWERPPDLDALDRWIPFFNPIYQEVQGSECGGHRHSVYRPEGPEQPDWTLRDVTPDGDALLLTSPAKWLRLLDLKTGRSRWRKRISTTEFHSARISPAGQRVLALVESPPRVIELDAEDGSILRIWRLPDWRGPPGRLCCGDSRTWVVGAGVVELEQTGTTVRELLADQTTGQEQGPGVAPPEPYRFPTFAAVSRDGGRTARVERGVAVIRDVASGSERARFAGVSPQAVLLFSPEGDALLWSQESALRIGEINPLARSVARSSG